MPHQNPRASLLILHGLSEHSGRYAHVAAHLMLRDVAVYAYDHRHHGRSDGEPRAYLDDFSSLVRDLELALEWVQADSAQRPVFVMGHSLGGAVLMRHIVDHGAGSIAGVILSAPAIRFPDTLSPFLKKLSPLLDRLTPRLPTTKSDRAFLSRDPKVYRNWQADPLTYKQGLRVRTGRQILLNSVGALNDVTAFTMPLLIIHGSDDRIADIAGSRALFENAPSEDKTLRVFEEGYHETLNDLEQEEALKEIALWITERC